MQQQLILYPSKLKLLLLLMISCVFTIGGVMMIIENANIIMGYISGAFFGLGIIVFILQLLPNSSYLKLTPDGFEVTTLFRSQSYRWRDIESFKTDRIMFNKMVLYNFIPEYSSHQKKYILSRGMVGMDDALPDTYGYKAEELVKLMSEWHSKFVEKNNTNNLGS